MEMTEQRLAEIEARAKAAAPGEWVDHEFGFVFLRGDPQVHAIVTIDHEDVRGTSTADLSFIAHARTDVPALVAEVRRLRATIDGSPDEPTDAELAAHRGTWLARLYNGAFATLSATSARNARGVFVRGGPYAARWWALDPGERFCPRPVVTTVAATLDAGPRDGDGREVTP